MGRLTITATAPTQWTQTIINFLHHKIFSLRATPLNLYLWLLCGVIIRLAICRFLRDYRCSYNLIINLFLVISICFWCKYKAIKSIFQTKNTYSIISENYIKGNICIDNFNSIYSPLCGL